MKIENSKQMFYDKEPFLQQVINQYPAVFNPNEILEYFKNKVSMRNLKPIADNTKVSQLSIFKKVLKKIKDIPELKLLTIPELTDKVNKRQQEIRDAKHDVMLTIPNSTEFIKKTLEGLYSNNFNELYPALLLATGRRACEIYYLKEQRIKIIEDDEYLFKHQLKKRMFDNKEYIIKLLAPRKALNSAIRRFRKIVGKFDKLKPEELNAKFKNHNLNAMKSFGNRFGMKLKTSDLRRIYVAELYRRSNTEMSYNLWIKNYLGHDNLETSLNYSTVKLLD